MRIYRISNHRDLNGDGGRRAAGRWHSKGRAIVYCAATPAAAMLEAIAYVARNDPTLIPATFQLLTIELPDDVPRESVSRAQLPLDWQAAPAHTRAIGDAWLREGKSAVLVVPSALAPHTESYLLNPAHPDLQPPGGGRIRIVEVENYPFDSRLFEGPPGTA
jgi:RES domain-containing protein